MALSSFQSVHHRWHQGRNDSVHDWTTTPGGTMHFHSRATRYLSRDSVLMSTIKTNGDRHSDLSCSVTPSSRYNRPAGALVPICDDVHGTPPHKRASTRYLTYHTPVPVRSNGGGYFIPILRRPPSAPYWCGFNVSQCSAAPPQR